MAATVDLAIHVGEVLYGNVGAADRLDFAVIGPAVNEVARTETLCANLGVPVLVSAPVAAAVEGTGGQLKSLGPHTLRGVRESRELFGWTPTAPLGNILWPLPKARSEERPRQVHAASVSRTRVRG